LVNTIKFFWFYNVPVFNKLKLPTLNQTYLPWGYSKSILWCRAIWMCCNCTAPLFGGIVIVGKEKQHTFVPTACCYRCQSTYQPFSSAN